MCERFAYTVLPFQARIHPVSWCCGGHVQAPDQAVGLTQPTSTSCPHIQAETKPCTGCFPAKLLGETVDDQSTLTAAAAGFGFLGSGNTGKSRGRELFYSDACKECDSFLYSSVNTLAT